MIAKVAQKVINRRLFLKSAPAVPLAAPSLAKSAVSGEHGLYGRMSSASYGPAGCDIGMGERFGERKAELLRIIAGKPDEREEYRCDNFTRQRALAYNYDGLRSLSPVMRLQFFAKAQTRLRQSEAQGYARFELTDLMKRIAGWKQG